VHDFFFFKKKKLFKKTLINKTSPLISQFSNFHRNRSLFIIFKQFAFRCLFHGTVIKFHAMRQQRHFSSFQYTRIDFFCGKREI